MLENVEAQRMLLNIASRNPSRSFEGRIPIYPDKDLEVRKHGEFTIDCFRGTPAVWNLLKPQLSEIHKNVFSDIKGGNITNFLFEVALRDSLSRPTTEVILLRDAKGGKIVGYTSIFPSPVPKSPLGLKFMGTRGKEYKDLHKKGMTFEEYQKMSSQTLEVGETAILPEFRNRGGWSLMMEAVDETAQKLKKQGAYKWMLRVVRTREGYAQNIKRRYTSKELAYRRTINQALGEQEYLRFAL